MEHDHRRRAAVAGYEGDEAAARALLSDADPGARATAMGALARMGRLGAADVEQGLGDADARVRRRACEEAIPFADVDLAGALGDADVSVVEAAAWALGERGAKATDAVDALTALAQGHDDPLCREAAVAALGAIGDDRGLPTVLAAAHNDRPAVRRRAVVALAAFEGPDVEAALRAALNDRDWQVRQAAEDLLAE
ncbi:MAG: HEAT repeat domain-containing protein [Acidimicrobiia bacterium]|nr:HEAT repeat domain-containing protein [Acidimicrobiia bacterium]MBV9043329.1 HEAT repeat domain-containing protein [Acidimicrobiia bacterium]